MDHLRVHHREQHDAVVLANTKGLTLPAFNAQRQEPRVRAMLGNSTVCESTDIQGEPHKVVEPAQNVVDVANLAKEVSPSNNNFQSPLLYTC